MIGSGRVSTEGELRTRYYVADGDLSGLTVALDAVIVDARRLGIRFGQGMDPQLYVLQDGDDPTVLPSDWRRIVGEQAARLGWRTYREAEVAAT